jgi:multimeric flavodoxin WrbA/putative sterol carrier protein
MKVLAINSSAREQGQSKTELMLDHLVRGMRDAGANVEVINLREKKIKDCIGCFSCMTKTIGKCVLKDDMTKELFPKWLDSELVIYATPLFHHTVNAIMKRFIERTFPICEPFLLKQGKLWVHPLRSRFPAAVVLSVCGFPEMSAFGALTHYVNFLFNHEAKGRLWAEIYRPGSEYLIETMNEQKDILDATEQAGIELVKTHKVSQETLARIEQPLIDDFSNFAKISNCMWQTCIDEGVTRKKYTNEGMIPRADSIETYMLMMKVRFNSEGAGDTEVTIQNDFIGRVEGSCHFIISHGTVQAKDGKSENPDLIIKSPFDVWIDIVTGKADGTEMIMEGKYQVEGNTDLIFDVPKFFRKKEIVKRK